MRGRGVGARKPRKGAKTRKRSSPRRDVDHALSRFRAFAAFRGLRAPKAFALQSFHSATIHHKEGAFPCPLNAPGATANSNLFHEK